MTTQIHQENEGQVFHKLHLLHLSHKLHLLHLSHKLSLNQHCNTLSVNQHHLMRLLVVGVDVVVMVDLLKEGKLGR